MKKAGRISLLAACALAYAAGNLWAQTSLRKNVVAAGGGTARATTLFVQHTIGQAITGTAWSGAVRASHGFWSNEALPSSIRDIEVRTGATSRCEIICRPNPVLTTGAIDFSTPAAAHVCLALYDVTGRFIHVLYGARNHPGGRWTCGIDAAALPSGMYTAVLSADENRSALLITLVR